jgi:hypothetical protein
MRRTALAAWGLTLAAGVAGCGTVASIRPPDTDVELEKPSPPPTARVNARRRRPRKCAVSEGSIRAPLAVVLALLAASTGCRHYSGGWQDLCVVA